MKNNDIHSLRGKLDRLESRIIELDIPSSDRTAILQFRDQGFADGLGIARNVKYMQLLISLYKLSTFSFLDATHQEIISLLARIELSNLSDWSKYDYKVALRKYLVYCRRRDLADLIRISTVQSSKLPEELLDIRDIRSLMQACTNAADLALISVLWESGCRIGELLGIMRKHVRMDSIGGVLLVNGKTGMRRIRIIESAPYLNIWISEQSPEQDERVFPWQYPAARKRLKTIAQHSEVDKRIYPHLFRHSRATYLANHLTEAQLCHYMGWTIGSNMARIYVHLSGIDIDYTLSMLPAVLPSMQNVCEPVVIQTELGDGWGW
ncbi:MAG: site-specific integrase [ANME-2 cluster archaeon]|nr:site-specific integrase [ANME-2 cluster archaeon]